MKVSKIKINNRFLASYESDVCAESSKDGFLGVLGIPRHAENDPHFVPGQFIQKMIESPGEHMCSACVLGIDGMGGSDGDTFQTTINDRAHDIATYLLDVTTARRTWLLGHSMGAAAILLALHQKPELHRLLSGITLVAPAAYAPGAEYKKFGPEFKQAIQDVHEDALWYADIVSTIPQDIPIHLYLPEQDQAIPQFISMAYEKAVAAKAEGKVTRVSHASHGLKGLSSSEQDQLHACLTTDVLNGLAGNIPLRAKVY